MDTQSGEIIHADLCGPMENTSIGRNEYLVCFTCNFLKLCIICFLKQKLDTIKKNKVVLKTLQNNCGRKEKVF